MLSERGFAMITALLVLVAVAGLGVGAVFLTTMNLKMAENAQTHAIARANADAGIEAAIVALLDAHRNAVPKAFPATFTDDDLPRIAGSDAQYQLVSYATTGFGTATERARVEVRGFGPDGAEFVTEALIGTKLENDPKYEYGMISELSVTINGASGRFLDAGLHTNEGVRFPGWSAEQFKYCTSDRDVNGFCPSGSESTYADFNDNPLSVWEGGGLSCGPPGAPYCIGGTVKPNFVVDDPIYVNVDYAERRSKATNGIVANDGTIDTVACLTATDVICDTSGNPRSFTTDQVRGKTIIATGDISVTCGASPCAVEDAVLVSTQGAVSSAGISRFEDSRVFSQSSLTIGGTWYGQSTMASAGNVNFTGTAETFESVDGTTVGVAVIAEGDINTNGGGGTQAVGVFMAGGSFNWNGGGGVYIRGSVLVKNGVQINGGFTIDSGANVLNPDLDYAVGSPDVISQR